MGFSTNFIKATREYNDFDNFVPAPYFRKSICFEEKGTLTLTVAVCGFYELYFNGQKITKGRLAPYISNPDHIIYADSYTVEADKGENVIGLHLGNGFVNDPAGHPWGFEKARFRSAPSFSLSAEFVSGDIKLEFDAEGFRTHPSPIIFDEFRLGERYDARLELDGWCDKGFDDSDWSKPIKAETPRGEIRPCEAEPILPQYEIKPVEIIKTEKGWRYDFVDDCSGVCRLAVKGKRGQEISLRHSDKLKAKGELELLTGLWFPEKYERDLPFIHRDIYTCRGDGAEVYTPTFTYHGFRYVEVEGITEEQATPELLTFVVMNSDVKECGGFNTSHKSLSELQTLARRSTLANLYYFPTDCPHREKQGWTGDASISSEQVMMNLRAEKTYREWLRNICRAQNYQGAIPGIVPTVEYGFRWGNGPAWDAALFEIPYNVFRYNGDTAIIRECAPAFMKYLTYLTTRTNEKGLVAWGLGDWIQPFHPFPDCPLVVSDTIMCYSNSYKAHLMLKAVGMNKESDFALAVANDFRNSFRKHLIDGETLRVEGNCQCAQSMALYYGLFNEDEWEKAFKVLVDIIHEKEDIPVIGMLGLRTLFHVLAKGGEADLIMTLMLREDACTYGSMLKEGATSLWERLNEPNQVSCSHNHHCHSHISSFLIKNLAGLDYNPSALNLKSCDIAPVFPSEVADASAYFDSPFGKITSEWKRDEEKITLSISVPEDFVGEIRLPKGYALDNGETSAAVKSDKYTVVKA